MPNSAIKTKTAVLTANEVFYAAFRGRDYEAMDAIWSRHHQVSVYHPGWPGITGREAVMKSWHRIICVGTPPEVRAHDAHVVLNGSTAMVTCTEDLGTARMIATNTFVLEKARLLSAGWKMIGHLAQHLPG